VPERQVLPPVPGVEEHPVLMLFRYTGQYSCGSYNGQSAIFVCSNGSKLLSAICGRNCELRNGLPYCV
jgi:hypothetical protein